MLSENLHHIIVFNTVEAVVYVLNAAVLYFKLWLNNGRVAGTLIVDTMSRNISTFYTR